MLGPKELDTHITRRFFGINGALPWWNKAKLRSDGHNYCAFLSALRNLIFGSVGFPGDNFESARKPKRKPPEGGFPFNLIRAS
jgi:hypothetical protein